MIVGLIIVPQDLPSTASLIWSNACSRQLFSGLNAVSPLGAITRGYGGRERQNLDSRQPDITLELIMNLTPPVSYQSPELDLPLYASSGLAKYPEVDHPRLTLRTLKVTSCLPFHPKITHFFQVLSLEDLTASLLSW